MHRTCKTIGALASLLSLTAAAQAQSYVVSQVVSVPGSTYRAYDFNNSAQVVGYGGSGGGLSAPFVSQANGVSPQFLSSFENAYAHAINDAGDVVGSYKDQLGNAHAYLSSAQGTITEIGPQPGVTNYRGLGINDLGQVVGTASSNGIQHAFLTDAQGLGFKDLGTLGGNTATAYDINNSGQVVGYSSTGNGETHAFMTDLTSGAMIDLGLMGGTASYAWAINQQGQATGYYVTNTGTRGAFITDAYGTSRDIGTDLHLYSIDAYNINNAGQVIGTYCTELNACHPYITGANGVGITNLDDLVSMPAGTGLGIPLAINDKGQLLFLGAGSSGYYILTPSVPEPPVYLLTALGMAGLALARRRGKR